MTIALLLAAAALAPAYDSTVAPPMPPPQSESSAGNRNVVRSFFQLLYLEKKPRKAFETYVAADYVQHNPHVADGREAAIEALEPLMRGSPNLSYSIERILVDGDFAAVHSRATDGPSDRGTAIVDIVRLKNGKIVEHWDVMQPVPDESANSHPMF